MLSSKLFLRQSYLSSKFKSLAILPVITAAILLAMSSNLVISLGMVGALSIVRFRTAVKDPRDTAFIFWCVVSGLACGTQNYTIVLAGSIVICLILFGFKKVSSKDNRYTLIVKGNDINLGMVEKLLKNKLKDYVCKGKYIKNNNVELIYDIKLDKKKDNKVVEEIHSLKGVSTVNLVANNTDTMG